MSKKQHTLKATNIRVVVFENTTAQSKGGKISRNIKTVQQLIELCMLSENRWKEVCLQFKYAGVLFTKTIQQCESVKEKTRKQEVNSDKLLLLSKVLKELVLPTENELKYLNRNK